MLHNLQIVSIYFNSSIQNDKFHLFLFYRILNFDIHVYACMQVHVHACMQVHVHVRAWVEARGRTVSVLHYHSYPTKAVSHWMWKLSPSKASRLFLPPPTPTPSAVVMIYAVMSGCWETELRSSSLGSKRSYPWSHFSNSFFYQILMHSGVHIRLFSISFLKLILLTNL